MNTFRTTAALLALAISAPAALAQQPATARSGDHPAIVVQRLYAQQGYDYVSKFYPHPAWLYLASEPPRPTMSDHPAVIVFKREQQRREALARAPLPGMASASVQR